MLKKSGISKILNNPFYLGKVQYKGELFEGKHPPIITEDLWNRVQNIIKANRISQAKPRKQRSHTFLLEGLVRCGWCDSYISPSYGYSKGRAYFYYRCTQNDHGGKDECAMKPVGAEALEEVIVERIKQVSGDNTLINSLADNASCESQKML